MISSKSSSVTKKAELQQPPRAPPGRPEVSRSQLEDSAIRVNRHTLLGNPSEVRHSRKIERVSATSPSSSSGGGYCRIMQQLDIVLARLELVDDDLSRAVTLDIEPDHVLVAAAD